MAVTPNEETYNGKINIDGETKSAKKEVLRDFAQEAVAVSTSTFKENENYIYENAMKVERVKAVMDLVAGSSNQREAKNAYDRLDFQNDEYLNRIGMGYNGSQQDELKSYMERSVFQYEEKPEVTSFNIENGGINIKENVFDAASMNQIKDTGHLTYGGVTYEATRNLDRSVTLNASSYGQSFQRAEGSSLTVDIDPLKGINTLHTTVESKSVTQEEQKSIGKTGSFERNGVTYKAQAGSDADTINISTVIDKNSSSYQAVMAQNNIPFSTVNYQMKGSGLSQEQIKSVCKDGVYDLGGMKFSAIPSMFTTKNKSGEEVSASHKFDGATYQRLLNNANNEKANMAAKVDMGIRDVQGKASVIADIQRKGQSYICNQSEYLKNNFNGRNARSCISHIDREIAKLTSAKTAGWEASVAALKDQKYLLQEFNKHGGRIADPTKGKNTMGKNVILGNLLGQDMMQGVNFYRAGIRTAKTGYRAITGVASNIGYMGSTFSNKIVQNALSSVAGKDYVGVERLKAAQKKRETRYYTRKDKMRAKKNGTYKEWRRDHKNAKFSAKGDRLDSKMTKLDSNRDKIRVARKKLTESGNLTAGKDRMLKAREYVNTRRRERVDKKFQAFTRRSAKRAKKAGPNVFKRGISAIKNSKFGKAVGAAAKVLKAPAKLLAAAKAFIMKWILIIVGGYLAVLLKLLSLLVVIYLVILFVSNAALPNDLKNRVLHGANYQQMIVTTTEEDIIMDLQLICEVDATNHFLSKRHIKNPTYPWYYASRIGQINKIWPWEEADNTTRYANEKDELEYDEKTVLLTGATGDLVYANPDIPEGENGNTYVTQADRTELSSLEANLLPIVAMSRLRYYEDLDFQRWPTVLGYTYYMFSISHDIARYDTEAEYNRYQYGDMEDDPGYDYELVEPCVDIYGSENVDWDRASHTLTRPTEICENIYVHDFELEGYDNKVTSISLDHASKVSDNPITKSIRQISKYAQKFFSKVTGNQDEKADTFDKGYTDSNDILTLNLRKASLKGIKNRELTDLSISMTIEQLSERYGSVVDIDKNASGIFMYDGYIESVPHGQPSSTTTRELNGLDEACDNVLYFPYGITEDDGSSDYDTTEARLIPGSDDGAGAIDGCHDHCWTKGCYTLICGEEERDGHYENADGDETTGEALNATWVEGHHHDIGCYDLSSFECEHGKAYQGTGGHAPWNSQDDHGCWKTVAICGGHCGGHVVPLINIVQKMTYEGLAQDDNFKTPYWLEADEIVNSAGYQFGGMYGFIDSVIEDNIVSVGQFRSYWMGKCNRWFSPMPRSPYTFWKTIGKNMIINFCNAWDTVAGVFNDILSKMTGGLAGNTGQEYEDGDGMLDSDDWVKKDEGENDHWMWKGWWIDENTIDKTLITEMESYTGTYKDNEFEAGVKNFADFDVQFGTMGLQGQIYTPEQIQDIINMIGANYNFGGMSGLTEKQRAILEAALSRCGKFGYSLTGSAHNNGINNDSGYSDCSGWVTGTLLKALGINYNTNAAGFASKGVYNGVKKPGSIIAHKNGGAGYSGHVMIYAGYLSDGPDGAGHYVMDCTRKTGSSLRRVSQSYLDKYKYVWNP